MSAIHNCHIHTFTLRHVPPRLMAFPLVPIARNRLGGALLNGLLRTIARGFEWRAAERLAAFVDVGRLKNQGAILERVAGFYPSTTRFVALSMDMDHMQAGTAPSPYLEQLAELRVLKREHPLRDRLLPFVAIDPRRDGLLELVRETIEEHGFVGLKVYPPLGFWPFDERLDPVYVYAQEHRIPVLAHCSRGGVHFRGRIPDAWLTHPKTGKTLRRARPKDFTDHLTDPASWRWVLERFPRLRLCLAHYGGDSEWARYLDEPWRPAELTGAPQEPSWLSTCSELAQAYDDVWLDIAYTAYDRRFHPLLKVLLSDERLGERILYGSDYYMVRRDITEREFSINLRASLGEDDYRRIAETNPAGFLRPGTAGADGPGA